MKPHDAFLELAAIAIDFPLRPGERGRLEQHLLVCPACARTAAALRGDTLRFSSLPAVALPERRGADILAAALHPPVVRHPLRLLAVAALLGLLLLGSLAVGGELVRRMDEQKLSTILPVPTASPAASAAASAAPSGNPRPSGTLAVTHADAGGTQWVETVSLDGSKTPLQTEGRDPAWQSDTRLLYTCLHPGAETPAVCTADFDGGQFDLLNQADRPALSPDGKTIAVHRGTIDVGETWLMSVDGVLPHLLTRGAFLRWSPDGTWLLGQPEGNVTEVAVVRADGSSGVPDVLAPGYDPAWSPDGQRIAYVVVDGLTTDAAAGTLRVLTPFSDVSETLFTAPAGSELSSPAWLPGGGLVFAMDRDLYRLDAGAAMPVRLTTGLDIRADATVNPLSVSADGRWVAFAAGTEAESRVGIASVDGGWEMLDLGGGAVTQPRWAPEPTAVEPAPSSSPAPADVTRRLGDTWTPATVDAPAGRPEGGVEAVTAGGPGFVAVGRGCIGEAPTCEGVVWTSVDGKGWQRAPASEALDTGAAFPMSGPEIGMFDVAACERGIVAVGYAAKPDMAATTWFSRDGITWQRSTLGDVGSTRVNAVACDGQRFVIVGEDRSAWNGSLKQMASAKARAAVWTSPDGRVWTRVPHTAALEVGGFIDTMEDPAAGGMADVMASPNGLVAVGSVCSNTAASCEPAAWVSVDGVTWVRATGMPAISGVLKAIAGSGTRFTAVGAETCDSSPVSVPQPCPALVLTSPDGRTWTQQPFPQAGDLSTLADIGGRYFATAPDGPATVWTSDTGSSWNPAGVEGGPETTVPGTRVGESHFAATRDAAVWLATPQGSSQSEAWVSTAAPTP